MKINFNIVFGEDNLEVYIIYLNNLNFLTLK